jgi:hypothetical protein
MIPVLLFLRAEARAMSFSSTLTRLLRSSWISLSLNYSPACWSPAPEVEFGVAFPFNSALSASDRLSDLPSRLY